MQNSIPDVKHHLKYGQLPEILFLEKVLVVNTEVGLPVVSLRHLYFPYVVVYLCYHGLSFIKIMQTKIDVHKGYSKNEHIKTIVKRYKSTLKAYCLTKSTSCNSCRKGQRQGPS